MCSSKVLLRNICKHIYGYDENYFAIWHELALSIKAYCNAAVDTCARHNIRKTARIL